MRKLVYKISSGNDEITFIKTYAAAKELVERNENLEIETIFEDVPEKFDGISPLKKKMLEQFGYVSPILKIEII